MRGLVLVMVLLSLAPVATAAPFDCTGAGLPNNLVLVKLECSRTTSDGTTFTTRRVIVDASLGSDKHELRATYSMASDADRVSGGCTSIVFTQTNGPLVNNFNTAAPVCLANRNLA